MDEDKNENRDTTMQELGRAGGLATKAVIGAEGYSRMGKRGGAQTSKTHSTDHYRAIGSKGGSLVRDRYGNDHFKEIGRKGGQRIKELIDRGLKAEETDVVEEHIEEVNNGISTGSTVVDEALCP